MIIENFDALHRVLSNLESLSRIEADTRQRRNVLLPQACAEAARQLRPQSDAMGVDVRLSPELPPVEVDAGGVELCLVNFLSNAIKYSDSSKAERWIEITGEFRLGAAGGELTVYVRDNGIGVPAAARPRLFESLGGRAWAEFPDTGGSVFAFSLPSRREEDAAAAGTRRPDGGSVA